MKLAFSSLACPGWTIEETVAAAVRYGYQAIEWRLADGETIEPDIPAEVLTTIRHRVLLIELTKGPRAARARPLRQLDEEHLPWTFSRV
jgi:hypothetical protein